MDSPNLDLIHKLHTNGHTIGHTMPKAKLALSLDAKLVAQVDDLVKGHQHPSRSAAVEAAIRAYLKQARERDYEAKLALLDPDEEQAMAEEWFAGEVFG